ncbi:MAG: thiolase domain-containing protein [Dehalococcoidales bacterium]|nr:thiolase domain-containing protein [Dehalococcoidales bacterium]
MNVRRVALVAGGLSKFGVRQATYRDLIAEAGKAAFDSAAGLAPRDIEGFLLSTVMPERFVFQTHVAPLAAETLGVSPSKLIARVELLCASGSSALRLAYGFIAAGLADVIMVVGAEKMYTPNAAETVHHTLAAGDREWDAIHGLTAPPGFALIAQQHMKEYGTTKEQLALVSVKNRRNGARNPIAQFRKPVTVEEVFASKPVAKPLNLFDCCPITDGAAAVVLASEDRAKDFTDRPIWIWGTGQAGGGNNVANVPGWAQWPRLRLAARNAYEMAGIKADDVDVAEVHDCFTISEIIEYEELGFCEKGEGGDFVEKGLSDYGGKVVVNPGGGLLSRGHPFGATGVAQGIEMMQQLRGEAGERQVPGAKIGLTHNLSGFATEHTIMIYGRDPK